MITELCKGLQDTTRHFSQFTYKDIYTIICVVTAQNFSDSGITSFIHCCILGKRPTALPKLNYVHGSHTSCESVDTIYPNEQIRLTVSRSGRNNQESKDIQLTAQINCSDVRGVAHIKIRCPREMLGESWKEQIHSVHSFCFRQDYSSEKREGNSGSVCETRIWVFQIQWEMECIAWEQKRKIILNCSKGHLD